MSQRGLAALCGSVLLVLLLASPAAAQFQFVGQWRVDALDGEMQYPKGAAIDGAGNVYVVDTNNHRIQKFNAAGGFIAKWGTLGTGDGQFRLPQFIAVDGSGNVYVADGDNNRVQKFNSSGAFLAKWGSFGSGDGQFRTPTGIAADSSGNVYVAELGNHRVQKFSSSGTFLTKWGSAGSADGELQSPQGAATDSAGNVYVADTFNNRIQKFSSSGAFITKWGVFGSGDGQMWLPQGVAVSGSTAYVTDANNHRVQRFNTSGSFLGKWGSFGTADSEFNFPKGIAAGAGNVFVVDSENHRVQHFDSGGAFVDKFGTYGLADNPWGVAVAPSGNVYVPGSERHRVLRYDSSGALLGSWGSFGSGNGQFQLPLDAVVDGAGNVYVVDYQNQRIQKFNSSGGFLTKWGSAGSGDGQFQSPTGIALDAAGNVYVADRANNRIQKFTSAGAFTTKWGAFGSGDGQFKAPEAVTVDAAGNVYVADRDNNRIQKFSSSGAFLGKWGSLGSGNGQLSGPQGLAAATDPLGGQAIYVADTGNHRIQEFDAVGSFREKVGSAGSATSQFQAPAGIAATADVFTDTTLFVADTYNQRIQRFRDIEQGTIVVQLDAQPNDAQDFSFTAGGGLSPSSFQLDDDSDGTLAASRTFAALDPGSGYSLSQSSVPSGWDLTSATCSDGSPISNINLSSGENVTCTFTNRKRGRIVVNKDAQPNDAQDFSFTAGEGLSPSSFQLDDDSDGTLSNTRTFNDVVPGGGYSLSETVPAGWDQTSASCDDGSAVGSISVSAGETVTCTFTNRKRGKVVVIKDAQPDNSRDFDFTAGGGLTPTTFSLDDDGNNTNTLSNTHTFNDVVPAAGYSLSETVPSAWNLVSATCDDGSPVSTINVAAGETVTCTFVNHKDSSIVAVLDSQPNDLQDFSFTAGGGLSPSSFQLDDDGNNTNGLASSLTFNNVVAGSGYSLSQSSVPAGWDLTSSTCSDGSPISNIDVAPGENVTCTFTNRKRGQIVVVEDSQPNDAQDFSFTAGGGLSPSSFQLDDDSDGTLSNTRTFNDLVPAGGYSLSQSSPPAGWDLSSSTCSDGSPISNINVAAGETVTCTFTNRKRGQIVVVEDSEPNDAQDFSFTANGLTPSSFQLDDDSDGTLANTRTYSNVVPTAGYSLSETVPSGWDLASATCDDGSPISNIDVGPAETVTCTFTNEKRGQIVVVEDSQPNDPQDFSFTAGGGLSPSSFQLDDDSDGTLSNTHAFVDLVPANGYSLSETVPGGWDQTSASCDDGSPISNIDVAPAETVTCTFTNRKRGQIVVVEDSQPNDPQDFSFTAGGGLSPSSFQLDDDSDGTLSNTRTFSNVVPVGSYSIAETVPSGWDLTSATCNDGSAVSSIGVAPGEVVTCTFTNRKRSSIVVVKNAQPNDPQDFDFTASGGLSPASFQLDDDSDGTLSNTHSFNDLTPASGYSISETVPSGWDQTGASCDDGSPVANIDVAAGETVTCTFTNRKRGQIVVVEDSQPNDPQDFSFTAGGGLSPSSFQLDDDSDATLSNTHVFEDVVPGSGYSLAGTIPSGWDRTGATCDNGSPLSGIDVAAGETVTCTFTHRKRGNVVVIKDAQPDSSRDFDFTAGGGLTPTTFSLDDDGDNTNTLSNTHTFSDVVPAAGYSLTETVPPAWELTSATCDDGSPVSNISVAAGETVTCTFTNRKLGQIVVVKDAQPNDPQDFNFTAGGGLSPSSFQLDDDGDDSNALSSTRTFTDLGPGSGYSLAETVPAGWDQTSATCDDASPVSNIDVAPGEIVTCTFTNLRQGQLVVVKDAQPNDPQDFDFTAGGGVSPSSFQLDDDTDPALPSQRSFDAPPGSYSVAETVPGGWQQTAASCSDGSPLSNVAISSGETVTCTFVNQRAYPRPIGAAKVRATLVPALRECTAPDSAHGPPLVDGSCTSFALETDNLMVPNDDSTVANGAVTFRFRCSNAGTPPSCGAAGDQADAQIIATVNDVRCATSASAQTPCGASNAGSGSDYTGRLLLQLPLRITDRYNGPAHDLGGTVLDADFTAGVACTGTNGDSTRGGTCSLNSSTDAIVPDFAREDTRGLIALGQISVLDMGDNGTLAAGTIAGAGGICPPACRGDGDELPFMRQGIFVP